MKFEDHCQECINYLGKPYEEVHRWLDEFAGMSPLGMRHRRLRHHMEGVRQVKDLFGEEAGTAAMLHIKSDLRTLEQWNETMPFPRNLEDYVRMGFF